MYQCIPSFVFGFHGCEKEIGLKILSGDLHQREKPYTDMREKY
jgi:hypothetical protein